MRTLILLRHAKSDWSAAAGGAEDLARPLARRGLKEAAALGAFLAAAGELPDRAVSSPAVRALETLRLAMAAAGWRGRLERSDALYGSLEAALGELASQPDSASSVLFVGHEPTSSTLAGLLIGSGRLEMKTAACCRIDLDAERWSDAPAKGGRLCWLVSGRLLRRISG